MWVAWSEGRRMLLSRAAASGSRGPTRPRTPRTEKDVDPARKAASRVGRFWATLCVPCHDATDQRYWR
jgi:hypothetical protein